MNALGMMFSMMAASAAAPAITLEIDLPAGTVGAAYTGSVTATNVNGATGAITITATPLPDGLTVGTIMDNGDGSYTLPITGTPTTDDTTSVTVTATNGVQSATVEASVVVSEASVGGARVVQTSQGTMIGTGTRSTTIMWDKGTTAGNTLYVAIMGPALFSCNPLVTDYTLVGRYPNVNNNYECVSLFKRIADGTETGAVTQWTGSASRVSAVAVEIAGAGNIAQTGETNYYSANTANIDIATMTSSVTGLALLFEAFYLGTPPDASATTPPNGFTGDEFSVDSSYGACLFHRRVTTGDVLSGTIVMPVAVSHAHTLTVILPDA